MRFPIIPVTKHLIDHRDGNAGDFESRFLGANATRRSWQKQHVLLLGKGQFGRVLLVEEKNTKRRFACKILPKGFAFEANVLYKPVKPHVLRGEVEILRTLRGSSNCCLQLEAVYETSRSILVVTEVCDGGDLMTWAAAAPGRSLNAQGMPLRVEDVVRIARQLLTAVAYCDDHAILHRDIKPENVMFVHRGRTSDLRLIDFGSGCTDTTAARRNNRSGQPERRYEDRVRHHTMAGTAFYTAPKVFQRNYTGLADVWSAAVTLYVLVASYPANHHHLQTAFNLLHKSCRDLRTLPGHESSSTVTMDTDTDRCSTMPEAYFDFLTQALTYWPEHRPTAQTLLQHTFVESSSSSPCSLLNATEKNGIPDSSADTTTASPMQQLTCSLDGKTARDHHVASSSSSSSSTVEESHHQHHHEHLRSRIEAWAESATMCNHISLCAAAGRTLLASCFFPSVSNVFVGDGSQER
jgi:serine/threonine protein kinase